MDTEEDKITRLYEDLLKKAVDEMKMYFRKISNYGTSSSFGGCEVGVTGTKI